MCLREQAVSKDQTNNLVACAFSVVRNQAYATTWQWSGTSGLDAFECEHLARGPSLFPEGEGVAARCKGPWVVILAERVVPVVSYTQGKLRLPGPPFAGVHRIVSAACRPLFEGPASLAPAQVTGDLVVGDRRESGRDVAPVSFRNQNDNSMRWITRLVRR